MFSVSLGCSFKISCSSQNQWCHCFREYLGTVYPSSFPSHSRRASTMFVLRGISGSGGPKTPRHWKLHNIKLKKWRNGRMKKPWRPGKYCYFVMQGILVWAGQLRELNFLCQCSTDWGIYCLEFIKLNFIFHSLVLCKKMATSQYIDLMGDKHKLSNHKSLRIPRLHLLFCGRQKRDKERWEPGQKISWGYDGEKVQRKEKERVRARQWYRENAAASRWDKSLIIQIKTTFFWRKERSASGRQTGETALIYSSNSKIVTIAVIGLSW